MRRILFLLSLIVFLSMFNSTSAAEIRLFGKAGATYDNGKFKVCPGISLKTCAIVKFTWEDVRDYLRAKEQGVVLSNKDIRARIIILDEHSNVVNIIDSEVDWIQTDKLNDSSPDTLNGDEILFKDLN